MKISSPGLINYGKISMRYACDGDEINPLMLFRDVPKDPKSLVLIMEDPDVPQSIRKDGMWDLPIDGCKKDVQRAMERPILEQCEWIGCYGKLSNA